MESSCQSTRLTFPVLIHANCPSAQRKHVYILFFHIPRYCQKQPVPFSAFTAPTLVSPLICEFVKSLNVRGRRKLNASKAIPNRIFLQTGLYGYRFETSEADIIAHRLPLKSKEKSPAYVTLFTLLFTFYVKHCKTFWLVRSCTADNQGIALTAGIAFVDSPYIFPNQSLHSLPR